MNFHHHSVYVTVKKPAETSARMRSEFLHKLRKWSMEPVAVWESN